jgi:predicted MPP superfamily phosphohydrolase
MLTEGQGSDGPPQLTRRGFLRWTLGAGLAALAAGAGGLGYAIAREPGWLVVERETVRVDGARLPAALEGLKVLHLSDLHWGRYTGQVEVRAAVEAANSQAPDLIVVTGDYVLHSAAYAAPCARELSALQAPLGVFAIPGNHDYWTDIGTVLNELRRAGLTVLRNSSRRLEVKGAPLWLVGIDDVWERRHDLDAGLADVPTDEPVLLLVHEPDYADQVARAPHRVFLQLSGHSHGGQVNLPVLGRPILPWLGRRYPAGLQDVPGSALQVYTSRGIGVIEPPVRFNCRPEVAALTLARMP